MSQEANSITGPPPTRRPRAHAALTAAHHAHGKDGVVGDLGVSIVGELAEGVEDVEARVGDGDERQGEGHGSAQGGLPIPQLHREEEGDIISPQGKGLYPVPVTPTPPGPGHSPRP